MTFQDLKALFIYQLQDLYSAEVLALEEYPKLIKAASSASLKKNLKEHQAACKSHIDSLRYIFSHLQESPSSKKTALQLALVESNHFIDEHHRPSAITDAALIALIQKIKHYSIASLGTLKSWAKHLKLFEVMNLLQDCLNEEKKFDRKLTKLAEGSFFSQGINKQASEIKQVPLKATQKNKKSFPIKRRSKARVLLKSKK